MKAKQTRLTTFSARPAALLSFYLLITFFSPVVGFSAAKPNEANDELGAALAPFGKGTPQQLLDHIRSRQFAPYSPAQQQLVRESLPKKIVPLIVTSGGQVKRITPLAQTLFRLHRREGIWSVAVYKSEKPVIATWYLQVIIISTGMIDLLSDDELIGLMGHEIGHSYFADEIEAALKNGDQHAAHVAELQADVVAALSLMILGKSPSRMYDGLYKSVINRREAGETIEMPFHPDLSVRARIANAVKAACADGNFYPQASQKK